MSMKDFGLGPRDIEKLKSYSDDAIYMEIDVREEYGEFSEWTLALYTVGQLRAFIEHRKEFIEEHNAIQIREYNNTLSDEYSSEYDNFNK